MNTKYFIYVVVFILIAGLVYYFGFRSPKNDIKNYPLENYTIVAFGDSLVEGVGATKGNDFVSVLSRKINRPIINLGISGNTTEQGLARIDDPIAENPGLTFVLLGGNDFLRKVPASQTFANLRQIITRLQESGSVVVLLGIRGGILIDAYRDQFDVLAEDMGVIYVPDMLEGLLGDSRYMSSSRTLSCRLPTHDSRTLWLAHCGTILRTKKQRGR